LSGFGHLLLVSVFSGRVISFDHYATRGLRCPVAHPRQVEFLREHDFEAFRRFDSLQWREDGTYRVPMMYSLRASAPGDGTLPGDSRSGL
jgi:hypothetical protein